MTDSQNLSRDVKGLIKQEMRTYWVLMARISGMEPPISSDLDFDITQ